jgi:hypothetical protein
MGFDPSTGKELTPITKEIVDLWNAQKELAARKAPDRVYPDANYSFFDPVSGEPRVWYLRTASGEFEFYDRSGFSPVTGQPFSIISRDVIADWKKYVENNPPKNTPAAIPGGATPPTTPPTTAPTATPSGAPTPQPSNPTRVAQEVPGCRDAWNDLNARAALGYARILIETDCPVMYREGWLINPQKLSADVIPACVAAWNALASKGALSYTRFLVMHNCPVIERKGWR